MFDIDSKIKEYIAKNRKKCYALGNWKNLQMKPFSVMDILVCICKAANGSLKEMDNIIDHLTAKRKVFGRTQVYADKHIGDIDIVKNQDGELELVGYKPDAPLPLKGQHQSHSHKVFRKSDDQVSKTFQNAEERLYDLGQKVRELFPDGDNHFITFAMQAIRKYASERKIHTDKVIKGLEKGRYRIDTDIWRVVPNLKNESKENNKEEYITDRKGNIKETEDGKKVPKCCPKCGSKMTVQIKGEPVYICKNGHYFGTVKFPTNESNEKRTIIINESDFQRLRKISEDYDREMKMTEQKFHSNMRNFISQLLQDPVNAQPSTLLKTNGLNRSILLKYLLNCGILVRDERICDRDENSEPKTATMIVKFRCPKKNFDRKIQKLYMRFFEKNLPQRQIHLRNEEINEEGEGGAMGGATSAASSGQFIQPFGGVQRRKMPTEIEETTSTMNTGNYQYTVPFGGDKETLARKNGDGGSVSINHV